MKRLRITKDMGLAPKVNWQSDSRTSAFREIKQYMPNISSRLQYHQV